MDLRHRTVDGCFVVSPTSLDGSAGVGRVAGVAPRTVESLWRVYRSRPGPGQMIQDLTGGADPFAPYEPVTLDAWVGATLEFVDARRELTNPG